MNEYSNLTANVAADAEYELEVTGVLDTQPIRSVDDLQQELPELGYYEAALHGLRGAALTEQPAAADGRSSEGA